MSRTQKSTAQSAAAQLRPVFWKFLLVGLGATVCYMVISWLLFVGSVQIALRVEFSPGQASWFYTAATGLGLLLSSGIAALLLRFIKVRWHWPVGFGAMSIALAVGEVIVLFLPIYKWILTASGVTLWWYLMMATEVALTAIIFALVAMLLSRIAARRIIIEVAILLVTLAVAIFFANIFFIAL